MKLRSLSPWDLHWRSQAQSRPRAVVPECVEWPQWNCYCSDTAVVGGVVGSAAVAQGGSTELAIEHSVGAGDERQEKY